MKKGLFFALLMAMSLCGFSQTKQEKAKSNWNGFNIELNAGLLDGYLDKFYGESATRFSGDPDWTVTNLLDYHFGRGIENRSGGSIGLHMGYNWVLPHRFLLGAEVGAAKTKMEFELLNKKISQEIYLEGVTEAVENVDMKMLSSGNAVLGKVFGKNSDYLIYAKGGVVNGLMRYNSKNDYSREKVSAENVDLSQMNGTTVTYVEKDWNWGWNVGGGFKYAVRQNLSVGLEYMYTKFNDLEQTTGSVTIPYQQQIRTKQCLYMHSLNLNLTLNL